MSRANYLHTMTGKLRLDAVEEYSYDIEEIALSLSKLCRFTGHPKKFYSVAQHSILCYEIANTMLIEGTVLSRNDMLGILLHDAAEAYVGDISHPLKLLIPAINDLERRIQSAIYKKHYVKEDELNVDVLLEVDRLALFYEQNYLFESPWEDLDLPERPLQGVFSLPSYNNIPKRFVQLYNYLS